MLAKILDACNVSSSDRLFARAVRQNYGISIIELSFKAWNSNTNSCMACKPLLKDLKLFQKHEFKTNLQNQSSILQEYFKMKPNSSCMLILNFKLYSKASKICNSLSKPCNSCMRIQFIFQIQHG